jgi:hypothetical protein
MVIIHSDGTFHKVQLPSLFSSTDSFALREKIIYFYLYSTILPPSQAKFILEFPEKFIGIDNS